MSDYAFEQIPVIFENIDPSLQVRVLDLFHRQLPHKGENYHQFMLDELPPRLEGMDVAVALHYFDVLDHLVGSKLHPIIRSPMVEVAHLIAEKYGERSIEIMKGAPLEIGDGKYPTALPFGKERVISRKVTEYLQAQLPSLAPAGRRSRTF
jgi:hypothetical protein